MSDKQVLIQKKEVVNSIKQKVSDSNLAVFMDFRGLSVPDFTYLRSEIRKNDGHSKVYKNTLTRIALKDLGFDYPQDFLTGPSLLATSGDTFVEFSKAVVKYVESNEDLKIKGGILNDKVITAQEIVQLSKLPSREELLANFVGQLNAPISGFANVLSSQIKKLVLTLKAIEDKKTGGEN
jgi:large subunit ribosomal protein L10